MWPFPERRRSKRYRVEWTGLVRCVHVTSEETLSVKVAEISMTGARLALERLRVGSYHLMGPEEGVAFELSIPLPEGSVKSPVEMRWFNFDDESRQFFAGVEFMDMDDESRSDLKRAIDSL